MKMLIPVAVIFALSACSTPKTVLKNEATGETVACGGGGAASYLIGGMIGQYIQRKEDKKCVDESQEKGMKILSVEKEEAPAKPGGIIH